MTGPSTSSRPSSSSTTHHSSTHATKSRITSTVLLQRIARNDPTLREIHLDSKMINDTFVQKLSVALLRNTYVTQLWLRHNQITSTGAFIIAALLKNNDTITDVMLGHNQIDSAGAKALAWSLVDNTGLIALGIDHNRIDVRGLMAFQSILQSSNDTLEVMDVRGNLTMQLGGNMKHQLVIEKINDALIRNRLKVAERDGQSNSFKMEKMRVRLATIDELSMQQCQ